MSLRSAESCFPTRWATTGTYEGTYIGMLDHNITLVARGLGGDAPEKGHERQARRAEHGGTIDGRAISAVEAVPW